jgi:hypothetical protein
MKQTNQTIIISGSTVESYKYKDSPLYYDYTRPAIERFPIVVIDEESKQRKIESRKSSQQRARSVLRRLINANAWKWLKPSALPYLPIFLTFTFAENIKDTKVANPIFSKFIKRLNYEITGQKESFLKYVVVTEFQERGAVHFHTIFFNLKHIWVDTLTEIWGEGFIKLKKIEHVDNVGAYICKYMAKDFDDDRLDGKKRYFSSRGLIKPTVIKDEEKVSKIVNQIPEQYITQQKEFERKHRGKKIGTVEYTQFLLDKKQSLFDIIPDLNTLL